MQIVLSKITFRTFKKISSKGVNSVKAIFNVSILPAWVFHVLGSSILAVPTVDYALWSLEALLTSAAFVCSEEIQLPASSEQR